MTIKISLEDTVNKKASFQLYVFVPSGLNALKLSEDKTTQHCRLITAEKNVVRNG